MQSDIQILVVNDKFRNHISPLMKPWSSQRVMNLTCVFTMPACATAHFSKAHYTTTKSTQAFAIVLVDPLSRLQRVASLTANGSSSDEQVEALEVLGLVQRIVIVVTHQY
jgi:hypothetical protein